METAHAQAQVVTLEVGQQLGSRFSLQVRGFATQAEGNLKRAIEEVPSSASKELAAPPGKSEVNMRTLRQRYFLLPRFNYFFKKQQPWTVDDVFAMFSWLVFGNAIFIVIGTTTFGSLVLWVANTLQFQGKRPSPSAVQIFSPPGNISFSLAFSRISGNVGGAVSDQGDRNLGGFQVGDCAKLEGGETPVQPGENCQGP